MLHLKDLVSAKSKKLASHHFSNNLLVILASFLSGVCLIAYGLSQMQTTKQATQLPPAPSPTSIAQPISYTTQSGKPIQFVLLSFDGSLSLKMWQDTRAFAQEMNRDKTPLHFTYFISGVYFLGPGHTREYQTPGLAAGSSAIGFSPTIAEIPLRIQEMNLALDEGNEIGSHANGHYQGGLWNQKQWEQEFQQFNHLIFDWQTNNGLGDTPNIPHLKLQQTVIDTVDQVKLLPADQLSKRVIGFRAPLLSKNQWLYQTLPKFGYLYDASGVTSTPTAWPIQNDQGTWLIPLANIQLADTNREIISMDYNFYSSQTQTRDLARKGSALWQKSYQQMVDSYEHEFQKNYQTTRAPVVIGHHFSTWNDGAYWSAMQSFAKDVCGKPEVRCGTYRDLVQYLEWLKKKNATLSP